MARDSLFGERIVWQGGCRTASVPFVNKVTAGVASVASAVALCYAVVVAKSLLAPVGGMVFFAGWCATIALAAWRIPIWWRSQVEYILTERHVIWRRGRLRRSIDRRQISYALVRWSPKEASVGDLFMSLIQTGPPRK